MELRRYFAIVRKYLWLILITTALGCGVAYYFYTTEPVVYHAATTLEIDPMATTGSDPLSSYYYNTSYMVERAVDGFAAKIYSPPFMQEVKERLGLAQIGDSITIEQVGETQFVRISVESGDPARAQALANMVAQVLIEHEVERQQARFQDSLSDLEAQIEALETSVAEARAKIASLGDADGSSSEFVRQERAQLESQITRDETRLVVLLNSAEEFRLAMARSAGYISVFFPAELPAAPARSSVTGYLLRGAVAGLVVGGGIAFLLDYLDDTIKAPQDVRQALSLDVLAALPRVKSNNGRVPLAMVEHPLQPISEAFRSLRTNVEFATVDLQVRSILVTSPLPTDGKTFVAANLAAAFAQAGKRVVLVDADLRHPRQHHQFDLPKGPGLTSALLAPEKRDSVLQSTGVDGLWVITAGPQAPNPAEMLASERMRQFVSWLKEEVDVVVIDSPPVLAVTDAAVLSNLVDGTIFVMECNRIRRPVAIQAMERLASAGGKVLGVVLNRMKPNGDGYYYYYYYHGYYGDNGASGNHRRGQWLSRLLGQGRHRSQRRRQSVKEEVENVEERR